MRISSSGFRRFPSVRRRVGAIIGAVLLVAAAGSAWAVATHWLGNTLGSATDAPTSPPMAGARTVPAAIPRIELSTHRLDLGNGKPNEELHGELVVTNRFTEPLDFSVTTSCGCLRPDPMAGTLAGGQSVAVQVGIKLADHANFEKAATVTVHGGTPSRELGTCAVLARCPAPFTVSPGFVEFGTVSREQVEMLICVVRVEGVRGQPAVSVNGFRITQEHGDFQTETSAADDGAVLLRVTLSPDRPNGDYYDTLELQLAGSDYGMRVPLHVQIAEPVSVVPGRVLLRRDRATGRVRPATVLIMSRPPARPVGPVHLVDGPAGLLVEDAGAAGANRRVRLSIEGEIANLDSVVRLGADGLENDLSFKLVLQP